MAEQKNPLPTVYTIPSDANFIEELAKGLVKGIHGTESLSDLTLLLPNQRAKVALQAALLEASETDALVMPRIWAIGEVELEEAFADFDMDTSEEGPRTLDQTERLFILSRLIFSAMPGLGFSKPSFPHAFSLAEELGSLMDRIETENLDFGRLNELVPDELAKHWQISVRFLSILKTEWPRILAEKDAVSPAEARNRKIMGFNKALQTSEKKPAVIIAGSTGSFPATADLMRTVCRLPRGAVILPGVDMAMPEDTWKAVRDECFASHPQHRLANLTEHLGIHRAEIRVWPDDQRTSDARMLQIQEALYPAGYAPQQKAKNQDKKILGNIHKICVPTQQEEAGAIALLMREVLEKPEQTAALVTPDRTLSRRVQAELKRWGIEVDDSAGTPLQKTETARLFRLILDTLKEELAPVPFLALLKHPLVQPIKDKAEYEKAITAFEINALRGPRPAPGFEGLEQGLEDEAVKSVVRALKEALAPLEKLYQSPATSLVFLSEALLASANALNAYASESIWQGEVGRELANFFETLAQYGETLGSLEPPDFQWMFEHMMERQSIRRTYGVHPRLFIWGTVEARMQRADVMILGGLTDGIWPPTPSEDPWMSRPMRRTFGMTPPERRIGQSALDFVQALGAKTVYLTYSEQIEGKPTVPSRWLFRLESSPEIVLTTRQEWVSYYNQMNTAETVQPVLPPEPRPALHLRPTSLSVTAVERLLRDPYAIYAEKILKLDPLDKLDQEPTAAVKGTFTHDALEAFLKETKGLVSDNALPLLLEKGKEALGLLLERPGVWAFWWPRFERVAKAFIEEQRKRQQTQKTEVIEGYGRLEISSSPPFTLSGKADRIDRLEDGSLLIIDYKTGSAPTEKSIAAGFSPQLFLEAIIAQKGIFTHQPQEEIGTLEYWEVTGNRPPIKIKPVKLDIQENIERTERGLQETIRRYANPDMPYLSNPRPAYTGYGTYDHLARVKEWRDQENNSG